MLLSIVLFCNILELSDVDLTLKSGLQVTQDHWNCYHSKDWVWFPIRLPQQL